MSNTKLKQTFIWQINRVVITLKILIQIGRFINILILINKSET